MSNIVAARKLRKSMVANLDINGNLNSIENLTNIKKAPKLKEKLKLNKYTNSFEKSEGQISYFKIKILIKLFISVTIIFVALVSKLMFKEQAINNKYVKPIIVNYNKDYSKQNIVDKLESLSKLFYKNFKFLIPDKIKKYTTEKYNFVIKPKYLNFSLKTQVNNFIYKYKSSVEGKAVEPILENDTKKDEVKNIEKKESKKEDKKILENNSKLGIGGGNEIQKQETESSISTQNNDVKKILEKKINIIQPVYGVVTSNYGTRDEIFKGVNSYHTGIDIANKLGTPIKSATKGKVVKVELGNKYYGNNIEIETNGVIFKYAHLNSIEVKKNQQVNQSDIIGKMGSTGMSTGSHLHFEIKIDGNTVDPKDILEFK